MKLEKFSFRQLFLTIACFLWQIVVLMSRIIRQLGNNELLLRTIHTHVFNNRIGEHVKLHGVCKISDSEIGAYTYFGGNCTVKHSIIGKFCSIGPGFICGWGLHPTIGISTSPAFYSVAKQNGMSFCGMNKFEEYLPITIGNDVFIGANVIIFDGITVGNGAVIGAGAVVTNDVPAYAVVGGVPAKIIHYRFEQETIDALEKTKWWDLDQKSLQDVERFFFDIKAFTSKYKG